VTGELVYQVIQEETERLRNTVGAHAFAFRPFAAARDLFARVTLSDTFEEFFTTTTDIEQEAGK